MTPEERQLITSLFDRMRSFAVPAKDKEAEALISQSTQALPDAPYMLVQSVLVQEQALQQASARIRDLEETVRALKSAQGGQASGAGSFLGGLFGGGRPASEPHADSSVPQAGTRAAVSASGDPSPWSRGQSASQQQSAMPASGGFLRSAMTTAAGVAGGMLAAGAIRDLLGGSAHAGPAHAAETDQARRDHEALARQDAEDDAKADQDEYDDAQGDAEDDGFSPGGED